jgi:iron(III) transport system substrate-binding protein
MRAAFCPTTILLFLGLSGFLSSNAFAAQVGELLKVKQEAEAKGFKFIPTHDEIVAGAKQEGSLRAIIGFEPPSMKAIREGFNRKYPFIKFQFEPTSGTDTAQRFLLELKSGRATDWDLIHLSTDLYPQYGPYLERIDLFGMTERGVLQLPLKMVNPTGRNTMNTATMVPAAAYNKRLLSPDQVPKTWEDFLRPQYKGKKMMVETRAFALTGLVPAMGIEWVVDFARKLAAQEPIWIRGASRGLTSIAAGEYPLLLGAYYQVVTRQQRKGAPDLELILPEPVAVRDVEIFGIAKGAGHLNCALLFLEYLAGPEGQKALDEFEPVKASIHSPGSKISELVRGKKVSVVGWGELEKVEEYTSRVFAAFGFPNAAQ